MRIAASDCYCIVLCCVTELPSILNVDDVGNARKQWFAEIALN